MGPLQSSGISTPPLHKYLQAYDVCLFTAPSPALRRTSYSTMGEGGKQLALCTPRATHEVPLCGKTSTKREREYQGDRWGPFHLHVWFSYLGLAGAAPRDGFCFPKSCRRVLHMGPGSTNNRHCENDLSSGIASGELVNSGRHRGSMKRTAIARP